LALADAAVAVVVPFYGEGERRAVHALESTRVELRDDVAGFAGLEDLTFDRRRSATTARADAQELHFLLVNVFYWELEDRVGTARDRSKVVLGLGEHLRDPRVGQTLANAEDQREQCAEEKRTCTHGSEN